MPVKRAIYPIVNNIPNFCYNQGKNLISSLEMRIKHEVVHFLSTYYPHIVDKFFATTRYSGWANKIKNPFKLLDFKPFYEYN